MSIEETLKRVQREGEERSMSLAAAQLRKFISTALCACCGEPLGDGEIVQNDDETKTVHAECLKDLVE